MGTVKRSVKKKRSISSTRWLKNHFSDPHVQQAHQAGLRSRSWFKLQFIDQQYELLKAGQRIVELGAAPGGWTQFISQKLGNSSQIFACDRLSMEPVEHVQFFQGDFQNPEFVLKLLAAIGPHKVDLVLSDMAPNLSGNKAIDQPRCLELAESTLHFAQQVLKPRGCFVAKLFHGAGLEEFIRTARNLFTICRLKKPPASNPQSREVYLVSVGYR